MKLILFHFGIFCFVLNTFEGVAASPAQNLNHSADTAKVNRLIAKSSGFIQIALDSVLFYGRQAKLLSERTDYPLGKGRAVLVLSKYFNNKGEYVLSMENALAALHVFDSLRAHADIANTYCQLAYLYKTMASQNRTLAYLNTGIQYSSLAFKKYESLKDTAGMANSLIISGIQYRDKFYSVEHAAYFDTAFALYQKALALIETSGKGEEYLGKLYNDISQVYNEYEVDYMKALRWLFKAEDFNLKKNNQLSLSYNYGNISYTYRQLKDYNHALKYAQKMLGVAIKLGQPNRKHDAYFELFKTYKAKGAPGKALQYYLLADAITDSLSNIEKTQEVSELHTRYGTEKKLLQIHYLNLEKTESDNKITLLASGLGLVLILAIALVILYRRVRVQKSKLAEQTVRLEVMMKELHHRVKNNLQIVSSLLSLQTYRLDDEKTISVLNESRLRVQAMSLIHQRLYARKNLTSINLKEYIADLAETILASFGYTDNNFKLVLNIEKEIIDVDMALPIGLIVNEIVTNALKHAYREIKSPSLEISVTEKSSGLVLSVKDNGQGIDPEEWAQKNNSFGKQLIDALAKQLSAEEEVSVAEGTQFKFVIPYDKAA